MIFQLGISQPVPMSVGAGFFVPDHTAGLSEYLCFCASCGNGGAGDTGRDVVFSCHSLNLQ